MKLIWFKDVLNDPKAKQDLELTIRNSTLVLGRLREILEDQLRELDRQEMTPDYKEASWSHRQADRNGYRRHCKETIDLINIERE